ncbi:uncharacterized protein LOC117603868 isoform X2 [Osmia lignaria lignaria]|uniref:uncharacterized protein LOC117603868 isoform X2 n=1 Tax=Osmia lignaria lignaria TaxID=1437193 RepID=UPI00402B25CF
MMYQENEDNVKIIQQLIPGATLENLQAFHKCMSTDAVYKSGLPCGITSGLMFHFLLPKKLGAIKPVVTALSSFTAFLWGKIIYSPICKERVFGPGDVFAGKLQEKRDLHDNSSYGGSTNQEDQVNRLTISSDKLLEDDSSWSNFDPFLDSNVSHFNDTSNTFPEELTTEQTTDVKQRVTYDDLWAQHRDSQMNPKYKDFRGRGMNTERSAVPPQRESEKTAPPEMTYDEKNIWS